MVIIFIVLNIYLIFTILALIQVLEEFEKGNDVHILQVINFIREYHSTYSQMYTDDEIIEQIKCKIEFDEGKPSIILIINPKKEIRTGFPTLPSPRTTRIP